MIKIIMIMFTIIIINLFTNRTSLQNPPSGFKENMLPELRVDRVNLDSQRSGLLLCCHRLFPAPQHRSMVLWGERRHLLPLDLLAEAPAHTGASHVC